MVKPILKWAGGKRQLLDELYNRFPPSFNRYHEPFFGGGALFFDLEPADGIINDTNPRLVNFYEQVRDNPEEVIETVSSYTDPEGPTDDSRGFNETGRDDDEISNFYYQQRELFNRRPNGEEYDPTDEAALLLYLNRTCFNGLYRENSDGEFNVPIGRYTDPDWERREEVKAASEVLDNTRILNQDFEYILEKAKRDDLVYFDPPYEPMSPTEYFTNYAAEGFDRDDQERLLDVCTELDDRGIWVILSNSGVMHDMYDDAGFGVDLVGAKRSINSDGENRGEVDEIIATNVSEAQQGKWGQQNIADF